MTDILLIIFLVFLLFYSSFLVQIFAGLKKIKENKRITPESGTLISVIIPFRDEEENILTSLNCIEAQSLPVERFEVIYVNDHSDDSSLELLQENIKAPNIVVINMRETVSARGQKKRASF